MRIANPPDFLFICTDQQHSGMMSCAGNAWLRTPAMDSLAARGTRFTRAYAANPICVPSRFSMITGRMPSVIGLRSNRPYFHHQEPLGAITPEIKQTAIGHRLRAAGYETAYAGKQHLVRSHAEEYGFTVLTEDWRDICVSAAVDFLLAPHDAPIALQVHLMNPHDISLMAPRDAQETEEERRWVASELDAIENLERALEWPAGISEEAFYSQLCPPLPDSYAPQLGEPETLRQWFERPGSLRYVREHWDERRWRLHRWAYARLTESVDKQIGRVLSALADSGRQDRTFVIFSSDHGDMDCAHRLLSKGLFYEESARVPFIVAGPGVPAGQVDSEHLVSLGLDILPTLCDYAGAPGTNDPRGRSLRDLLKHGSCDWREDLPIESELGDCVVSSRWKYARYRLRDHEEELVDLRRDPGEMRNLASDPAASEALGWCRQRWRVHFGGSSSMAGRSGGQGTLAR